MVRRKRWIVPNPLFDPKEISSFQTIRSGPYSSCPKRREEVINLNPQLFGFRG
jgi:hypothetical protein